MHSQLRQILYLSILKWKQGEASALGTLPKGLANYLLPLFVMPPSGGFDHITGKTLGPLEHIKTVSRLHTHWSNRLVLIDAVHLDDDRHRSELSRHPLTEVLERAWLAGARACPVTSLHRSDGYQEAVRRFLLKQDGAFPICIRLFAGDLESESLKQNLEDLMNRIGCEPKKIVLVLDFEDFSVKEGEELDAFSGILLERINTLPFVKEWLMLVVASTSFPDAPKLKAGQVGKYSRSEWSIYARLYSDREEMLRLPMYGDYATENPVYSKPINAPPSAHLRYTTVSEHVIFKGKSTRKPNGYEAIFPVAEALVADAAYMGVKFSRGDRYIEAVSKHLETGNAPKWRWAGVDHHLNLILSLLGAMHGVSVGASRETDDGDGADSQLALFKAD